jgi:GntR family transcriptional regulator
MQARKPKSRARRGVQASPGASDSRTRYHAIANELQAAIANGGFALGATLPTEAELCRRYAVSRHTVREALRRLVDLGLIERRQGAGSRVVSARPKTGYLHTIRSLQELFDYTRDTRLEITDLRPVAIDQEEAELIPAPVKSRWVRITGLRWSADRPEAICHSVIFVHSRFAGALSEMRRLSGPIYALIEARSGERVAEALQEIAGRPLPGSASGALKLRANSPAVRVVRRYLDASGGPMMTSVNWHPFDGFKYLMRLRRDARATEG